MRALIVLLLAVGCFPAAALLCGAAPAQDPFVCDAGRTGRLGQGFETVRASRFALSGDGERLYYSPKGPSPDGLSLQVRMRAGRGGAPHATQSNKSPGANTSDELVFEAKAPVVELHVSPDESRLLVVLSAKDGSRLVELVGLSGDRGVRRLASPQGGGLFGFAFQGDAVYAHDMRTLFAFGPDGTIRKTAPLTQVLGAPEVRIESVDAAAKLPGPGEWFIVTRKVPGTPAFKKHIDEDNTALYLRSPFADPSTEQRLTPENLTAFSPQVTVDGKTVFFTGYQDHEAGLADPFGLYALDLATGAIRLVSKGANCSPALGMVRP